MSEHVPTPIEDYAVLGDLGTAALVSRRGSVDWLCLPRFDSRACFAALLGTPDHGRWLITPVDPDAVTTRRYVGNSFVLETTHETPTGRVRVTDVMPLGDGRSDLLRRIEGTRGHGPDGPRVDGALQLRPHPPVGDAPHRGPRGPHRRDHHGHRRPRHARAARRAAPPRPGRPPRRRVRRRRPGQTFTFSTTWFRSHEEIPPPLRVRARIDETIALSEEYAARSDYVGPYAEAVTRSLLVLRGLTHQTTGGIVAAATTSLPEEFGGERNWDYRFCWLRDAALTLEALLGCGYVEETELWRDWLLRAVAGDPEDMQIMYRVDGGRDLPERVLEHLPGYAGSRPVRVGNAAVDQRQTDVLGEVMISLDHARSTRARGERRLVAPAAGASSTTSPSTGRRPTTASGRSAARCGTSRTRASWCGPPSTARSAPSSSTASRGRSSTGASCATRCARRS